MVLEEGGIRYSYRYRVLRQLLESEDARLTVPALSSSLTKQTESSKPVAASPKLRKKVEKCRERRRGWGEKRGGENESEGGKETEEEKKRSE